MELRIWNCLPRIQLNNFIRAKSKRLIPYLIRLEPYFLTILLQNTGKCAVSYLFKKNFYSEIYEKREVINQKVGINLNWDSPDIDQKQIAANYDIQNVDFENEEMMKKIFEDIVDKLVKFKICIQEYI